MHKFNDLMLSIKSKGTWGQLWLIHLLAICLDWQYCCNLHLAITLSIQLSPLGLATGHHHNLAQLVLGKFPAQRPVTRSFNVFFDLHLNKRLSKQSWGWCFETLPCPIWRHCNEYKASLDFNVPLTEFYFTYLLGHLQVRWIQESSLSGFDNPLQQFVTFLFVQTCITCIW